MERYLYFNGHSSTEYCCHIEHKPSIPTPNRKYEEYEVAGRNGKLHGDQGQYENITVSYQLYFHGRNPTPEQLRSIKAWLCGTPGAYPLSDGYDPEYFYLAIAKMGDTSNILDKYGRFTVEFDCDPRHFLRSGQELQDMTNGQVLLNPLDQVALPYFEVTGNGEEGELLINGKVFGMKPPADKTVCCDAETWNAWLEDGTNANPVTGGIWPELAAGENLIQWSGGIQTVKIMPRWWTL